MLNDTLGKVLRSLPVIVAVAPVVLHCVFEVVPAGLAYYPSLEGPLPPVTIWSYWLPVSLSGDWCIWYFVCFPFAACLAGCCLEGFASSSHVALDCLGAFARGVVIGCLPLLLDFLVCAMFFPVHMASLFEAAYPIAGTNIGGALFYDKAKLYAALFVGTVSVISGLYALATYAVCRLLASRIGGMVAALAWCLIGLLFGLGPSFFMRPWMAGMTADYLVSLVSFLPVVIIALVGVAVLVARDSKRRTARRNSL